ncbi:MAG: hypothetical protein ACOVP8_05350 [Phycisphaerales bacterium]
MALSFATALRNSRLTAISTEVGTSGKLIIYAGTAPSIATSDSGYTRLAELTCSATFHSTITNGVLTVASITADTQANNSGTATFFRVTTSGGTAVLQGTVTATGGGGDLTLNSTSISANASVAVDSFTITEANT